MKKITIHGPADEDQMAIGSHLMSLEDVNVWNVAAYLLLMSGDQYARYARTEKTRRRLTPKRSHNIQEKNMKEHKGTLDSPCVFCGYDGPDYWQTGSHDENCPWSIFGGEKEREAALRTVICGHYLLAIKKSPEPCDSGD